MRFLHQSTTASRDRMVIFQHSMYACGMSRVIRRTATLSSPRATACAEEWRVEAESAPAASDRRPGRMRPLPPASVSACLGKSHGCNRSTAARHEER